MKSGSVPEIPGRLGPMPRTVLRHLSNKRTVQIDHKTLSARKRKEPQEPCRSVQRYVVEPEAYQVLPRWKSRGSRSVQRHSARSEPCNSVNTLMWDSQQMHPKNKGIYHCVLLRSNGVMVLDHCHNIYPPSQCVFGYIQ